MNTFTLLFLVFWTVYGISRLVLDIVLPGNRILPRNAKTNPPRKDGWYLVWAQSMPNPNERMFFIAYFERDRGWLSTDGYFLSDIELWMPIPRLIHRFACVSWKDV